MDPQLELKIPIPIMEQIISLSSLTEKLLFRVSCKRFLQFITKHVFSTITTTLCGNKNEGYSDGVGVTAKFDGPFFGVLDSSSNLLFVSDTLNDAIRKIDLSTNQVTTLCKTPPVCSFKVGLGNKSHFHRPSGLALHKNEKILYVSNLGNDVIQSINLIDEKVTTIVGNPRGFGRKDGIGEEASFDHPCGLALDSISNFLYVADKINHAIRRVWLEEKRVETLCGGECRGYADGSFEEAIFDGPHDIALNLETQELYVSDHWNHIIRVISLVNRTVSTLCGSPGVAGFENGTHTQAKFTFPRGLGLDSNSNCLYVSDDHTHVVRKISLSKEVKVDTLCGIIGKAGSKDGIFSTFYHPAGIVVDPYSQSLYVMDYDNNKIRKIIDKNRIQLQNHW